MQRAITPWLRKLAAPKAELLPPGEGEIPRARRDASNESAAVNEPVNTSDLSAMPDLPRLICAPAFRYKRPPVNAGFTGVRQIDR
jgi:hypothetical protein